MSDQEAGQRFLSANWIAQEVRRYLVYRSVLGLMCPDGPPQEYGSERIVSALLRQGQCYELTVGWGDGLQHALDQISTLVASIRS